MRKFVVTQLIVMGFLSSNVVFAIDRSSGCGLGRQIAPRKSLISTSTAATTDGISMPTQPSAMTSGTSGCAPHGLLMEAHKQDHFISTNIAALKLESAIGAGEHLAALGQFNGCSNDGLKKFSQKVKSNYVEIFAHTEDPSSIRERIQNLQGCSL